jgi:hypothetical protein
MSGLKFGVDLFGVCCDNAPPGYDSAKGRLLQAMSANAILASRSMIFRLQGKVLAS